MCCLKLLKRGTIISSLERGVGVGCDESCMRPFVLHVNEFSLSSPIPRPNTHTPHLHTPPTYTHTHTHATYTPHIHHTHT